MIKDELQQIKCVCGSGFEWETTFREDNQHKQFGNMIVRNTFHMDMHGKCKECEKEFEGTHYAMGKTKQNYTVTLESWKESMLSDGKLPEGLQQLVHNFQMNVKNGL